MRRRLSILCTAAAVFLGAVFCGTFTFAAGPHDAADEHREANAGNTPKPSLGVPPTVALTPEQIQANGVEIVEAGPGELAVQIALPGEIKLNADRVAHVVPRVTGVAREVFKSTGDAVKTGELMAVLDSRELASLKAAYLGARERHELAQSTFDREKGLWEKKISAEQDYLAAKQGLAEARIAVRSAEQQLHAIGFAEDRIKGLPDQPDVSYTRYEIAAPFDGVVIEKHITLGEFLKDDVSCFTIADLSTVWADLNVYQKDIANIRKGDSVRICFGDTPKPSLGVAPDAGASGTISYLGPVMGEQTRTAVARVVLPNDDGQWRPGQFVTAFAVVERQPVAVMISKIALQTFDKTTCVFVRADEGFAATPVTIGRANDAYAEVTAGLVQGQQYAVAGSFVLKAALEKGALHDEH